MGRRIVRLQDLKDRLAGPCRVAWLVVVVRLPQPGGIDATLPPMSMSVVTLTVHTG